MRGGLDRYSLVDQPIIRIWVGSNMAWINPYPIHYQSRLDQSVCWTSRHYLKIDLPDLVVYGNLFYSKSNCQFSELGLCLAR
jgi:hypothetical protein